MKRYAVLVFLLSLTIVFLSVASNAMSVGNGIGNDTSKKRKSVATRRAEEARRRAAEEARRRAIYAAAVRAAKKFDAGLKSAALANIANDNATSDDPMVRDAAIKALGNHAGTVVVMETQTGRIITMVNQQMAVREAVTPCSTIKLVTALSGIDLKVIKDPSTNHSLEDALANSRNPYFQQVGLQVGNDKFIAVAQELGLGKPTGINLLSENPGQLPYGVKGRKVYSHGTGTKLTAVQLAVLVTAITTAKKVTPFIPNPALSPATQTTTAVNLPAEELKSVLPGMKGSATYGTAHRGGMDPTFGVAAKTGTCASLGLVATVAPADSPKYTVVVITHGIKERGRNASSIANQVYQVLLKKPDQSQKVALK